MPKVHVMERFERRDTRFEHDDDLSRVFARPLLELLISYASIPFFVVQPVTARERVTS